MSAIGELREGDSVLVRGTVFMGGRDMDTPFVNTGHHTDIAADFDVVSIEAPKFKVGDRVLAQHHRGEILSLHGAFAWVQPDELDRVPWTVHVADMRRAPAEKPSAEIVNIKQSEAAE